MIVSGLPQKRGFTADSVVTVNGMRFEMKRFFGKLFKKTSGIEKPFFFLPAITVRV